MPTSREEFMQLIGAVNIGRMSRSQWRAVCHGSERQRVQQYLLEMAAVNAGEEKDRLALYQGAHAVLPLRGDELLELARLLVQTKRCTLEWADVLVDALFLLKPTGTSRLFSRIQEALDSIVASKTVAPADRRRHDWVTTYSARLKEKSKG